MDGRAIAATLALAAGVLSVPGSLWWATTERVTRAAAELVRREAGPDDLVVISPSGAPREDLGGLMRPFGDLATVVLEPDGPLPDLTTFPQARVYIVGRGLEAAELGATGGE